VEPPFHAALCRALGHPELAERQLAEGAERERAWTAFRAFFEGRSRDEALALLGGADACASPVRSTREVVDSALMERATRAGRAREEKLVRSPVRLPLPPLAEELRGAQLLARFAFSRAEIDELARAGALGAEG
jgi:crotonobetainyl-CoA:carnitine CoA-transferase CaiB-like acyl-CoA transferase